MEKKIGKIIREKRKKLGLTSVQLCEIVQTSQGYLSDLERSYRLPSDDMIDKLSIGLKLTTEEKKQLILDVGYERSPEVVQEYIKKLEMQIKKEGKKE